MTYCECPYCENDCGDYFDDCHEPDTEYEYTCPKCNKTFQFSITYYPSFTSWKTPCLNGEEHEYEPICGYPKEHFENRLRCKNCGKEIKKEIGGIE